MPIQNTSTIMMVRPASFQFNAQTAESNEYQNDISYLSKEEIKAKAIAEFDEMVAKLRKNGIDVLVIQDTENPPKPDAIFPNNWISMQQDGNIVLFPMKNENRQRERRPEIIQTLKDAFVVNEIIDLTHYEKENLALEGTGSIVFHHPSQTAYACISPRTDKNIFGKYCELIQYTPVVFDAFDAQNKPIYHTNVVMCVGDGFVVIGMSAITDSNEKEMLLDSFEKNNLEVVDLSSSQLNENFAGNMLQLVNNSGEKHLVLSQRAFESLTVLQIKQLEKYTKMLPIDVSLIEEVGGGSARCMMAEIFLEKQ